MRLAGIEIGGTKLQIVTGDERGHILERFAYRIVASEGANAIRNQVERTMRDIGPVDATCVGFGGPVDRRTATVWTSYHVQGWTGFNIGEWIGKVTNSPVVVENDANVAALGEAVAGVGRNHGIVFYVTLGSGVGGGIVINRSIYHGKVPGEVEFGHIRLDASGRTVQSSCSGWAVNEKVKKAAAQNKNGVLARLAVEHPGIEAAALVPAIRLEDNQAKEILESTAGELAFALSHVVHLFHPDVIVVGGGFSLAGELLRRCIEVRLGPLVMDAFSPPPGVRLSELKTDVVPVGALILAGQVASKK